MDRPTLSSSCYAIHLPQSAVPTQSVPYGAAAAPGGGPHCWNAYPGYTQPAAFNGFGTCHQQQCQHHQLGHCNAGMNWTYGTPGDHQQNPHHQLQRPSGIRLARGCSCHDIHPHRQRLAHEVGSADENEHEDEYKDSRARQTQRTTRYRGGQQNFSKTAATTAAAAATAAGSHDEVDDFCGELQQLRRRQPSGSGRPNRDEQQQHHHHCKISGCSCRAGGDSTSADQQHHQFQHHARRHNTDSSSAIKCGASPPLYRDHLAQAQHRRAQQQQQHHHRFSANDEAGSADAVLGEESSAFLHFGRVNSKV